jgi:SAM-dependent methyltransferase
MPSARSSDDRRFNCIYVDLYECDAYSRSQQFWFAQRRFAMDQSEDRYRTVAAFGKSVDFGKTASDYGRYRAGYPDELYGRLEAFGVGLPDQRILDLGAGTGFLGRGFARKRCDVTATDISEPLMREARRLDAEAGVAMAYVRAKAESLPFHPRSFDVVCAGQCWHWFDRGVAAAEAYRVMRPGGRMLIAHFDWIVLPGNVVEATERLITAHNPKWALGGAPGIYPRWPRDVAIAGFTGIETFSFDVMAPYSHEAWRGRIRASAGIGGSLTPAQVEAFDREFAALLKERFPADPMTVHHRAFALVCRAQ